MDKEQSYKWAMHHYCYGQYAEARSHLLIVGVIAFVAKAKEDKTLDSLFKEHILEWALEMSYMHERRTAAQLITTIESQTGFKRVGPKALCQSTKHLNEVRIFNYNKDDEDFKIYCSGRGVPVFEDFPEHNFKGENLIRQYGRAKLQDAWELFLVEKGVLELGPQPYNVLFKAQTERMLDEQCRKGCTLFEESRPECPYVQAFLKGKYPPGSPPDWFIENDKPICRKYVNHAPMDRTPGAYGGGEEVQEPAEDWGELPTLEQLYAGIYK